MKANRWVLAALLVFAAAAYADEFWENKPYTEWTLDQCKRLLEGGPWASHSGAADVQNTAFSSGGGGTGSIRASASTAAERRISYFAQLRSALPVRQAVVRRSMIENKYEKMSEADRKAFDKSAAAYLAQGFADEIVFVVEYSSNVDDVDRELARHWQGFPSGVFPPNTYLVGHDGVRITPTRFTADSGAGRSFQVAFPRIVNGEPIITPVTKSLILEIPAPTFPPVTQGGIGRDPSSLGRSGDTASRGLKESRLFFEFKPEKMAYKGKLAF